MGWMKTVVRELYGLFVDDGNLAVAVIVWLAVAWLVLPRLAQASAWTGVILFAGLAVILVESAWRGARK